MQLHVSRTYFQWITLKMNRFRKRIKRRTRFFSSCRKRKLRVLRQSIPSKKICRSILVIQQWICHLNLTLHSMEPMKRKKEEQSSLETVDAYQKLVHPYARKRISKTFQT